MASRQTWAENARRYSCFFWGGGGGGGVTLSSYCHNTPRTNLPSPNQLPVLLWNGRISVGVSVAAQESVRYHKPLTLTSQLKPHRSDSIQVKGVFNITVLTKGYKSCSQRQLSERFLFVHTHLQSTHSFFVKWMTSNVGYSLTWPCSTSFGGSFSEI